MNCTDYFPLHLVHAVYIKCSNKLCAMNYCLNALVSTYHLFPLVPKQRSVIVVLSGSYGKL